MLKSLERTEMFRRSGLSLVLLATRPKLSSSSLLSRADKETPTEKLGKEREQLSTYVSSASEAPELLQPYVEPTPFVSAKRVQLFLASLGIGATTVWTVYYLLSRAMSICVEEERQRVQLVVESNRLGMLDPRSLVPDFTAPSSFAELQEKMQRHEQELSRQQEELDRSIIMLHTEVVFRVKVWWNTCLTQLQEAIDRLDVTFQKRREQAVLMHIRDKLEREGYELVNLQNGKRGVV